jgi:pimeloyl-ACP methyl ester carboxylesterase
MNEISFQHINSNGINLRLAIAGEGPLIIFCHGWPESWYSYRHQLPSIAEAGYKAVTYDVRGYGESDKPHPIESYTMRELTADVIGILDALGYEEAITIGHDWGGPIALNTAALNTDQESEIKIVGRIAGDYNFAKNLTVGTSFGIDYTNQESLFINAPGSIRGLITPNAGSELKGSQSESFFRDVSIITNAFVRYDNDLTEKLNLNVAVFGEYN